MTELTAIPQQPPVLQEAPPRQRVRFTYEKGEAIKFISHQDETRLWERTLRRADLPLLYKQGFNPQPHIQFAAPLGLGMTGARELLDVVFSPPLPLDELTARIRENLPPGVQLLAGEDVPLKAVSPQSLTIGADYTILIYADANEVSDLELRAKIDAFLGKREQWRERERHGRRYRYNLRPLVFELRYSGYDAAKPSTASSCACRCAPARPAARTNWSTPSASMTTPAPSGESASISPIVSRIRPSLPLTLSSPRTRFHLKGRSRHARGANAAAELGRRAKPTGRTTNPSARKRPTSSIERRYHNWLKIREGLA